MLHLLLLFGVIFNGLFSISASALECLPIVKLDQMTHNCVDNPILAEAAIRCLKRFDRIFAKESQKLQKNLLKTVDHEAGKGQQKDEKLTGSSYELSKKVLDHLDGIANRSLDEITEYFYYEVYPEDFMSLEANRGRFLEFLQNSPCYQDNYKVLTSVFLDFKKRIEEIKKTRFTVLGLRDEAGLMGSELNMMSGRNIPSSAEIVEQEKGFRKNNSSVTEDPNARFKKSKKNKKKEKNSSNSN